MSFSLILTPLVFWLLIAAALCAVLVSLYMYWRVRPVLSWRRHCDKELARPQDSSYIPVSVIVYSQGDAEALSTLLPAILNQDYPANFEVIVVNDGENVDVRDTVGLLRSSNPNLYLTFTPEGVVNLSRKKLALTLGIKAARNEVVVLTTTGAEIESNQWLRRMMAPFIDPKIGVVLGYAYPPAEEDAERGAVVRAFDTAVDDVRWLSVAIAGKPFRGTELNLAYRKELFVKNKGFARNLNLHRGDDDIFISQIVPGTVTAVVLNQESMLRMRHGTMPRLYTERVLHRRFTEGFIKRRPRILQTLSWWLRPVCAGCGIAAAVLALPNLFPVTVVLVLLSLLCVLDIMIWSRISVSLGIHCQPVLIPLLALTYPFRKVWVLLRSKVGRTKKYTWE